MDVNRDAVCVKDLSFSYIFSEPILNAVNLTVPKAKIYGLLGPSGCGKTTLLKCTLGRLQPNSGSISIFGAKPGTRVCRIPGPGVGYMPQELSLYHDFTIDEILTYFGRIYAMNSTDIKDRVNELIKLLQLSTKKRLIGKLSGGQQRRVSLACALIHCPPLLILDEPTVGTDPILRQTIWYHLLSLCRSGLTIILTTHYIEEARNADIVGFMRNGKILAEDNPNLLLDRYSKSNLEEVFLKLCYLENCDNNSIDLDIEVKNNQCYYRCGSEEGVNRSDMGNDCKTVDKNMICDYNNSDQSSTDNNNEKVKNNLNVYVMIGNESNDDSKRSLFAFNDNSLTSDSNEIQTQNTLNVKKSHFIGKCSALLRKNFRRLSRNWGQLLFFIILPAIQLALLLLSISSGPTGLQLAVFNEEVVNDRANSWGHLFIKCINNKTFNIKYYDSFESAFDSVTNGQSYAVIDINERFTSALRLRQIYGKEADEETIAESQIRVHIDWSNQAIGAQIEKYIYEAIMSFAEEIAIKTDTNPDSIKIPLVFERPVYGSREQSLRDFVLPGCYILLAFFSTCSVTTDLILEERRDGLLERSLVAGITAFEYLLSHALTQFLILCLQIVFMLLMPFAIFKRQIPGSLSLVVALALSQGFCGITFGLMISSLCSDIIYGAMFITVVFFISIIIGGVFWPIENLPFLLRQASHLMPSTLPIQSMRCILFREWSLSYSEVYMGFVVTYVWFTLFIIIAIIFLRRTF